MYNVQYVKFYGFFLHFVSAKINESHGFFRYGGTGDYFLHDEIKDNKDQLVKSKKFRKNRYCFRVTFTYNRYCTVQIGTISLPH
jgi:hypothetical protein